MDLRLELAEIKMQNVEREVAEQTRRRFEKLDDYLTDRKKREFKNIENKYHREERRLATKYRSAKKKFRRTRGDIVEMYLDRKYNYHLDKPRYDCFQTVRKNLVKQTLSPGEYWLIEINSS